MEKLPEKLQQIGDLLPWEKFDVKNELDAQTAGAALSQIKKRVKEIDEYRLSITAPIKKGIRALEEHCKMFTDPLMNIDRVLRDKVQNYWVSVQQQKDKEELKKRQAQLAQEKALLEAAGTVALTTGSTEAMEEVARRESAIQKLESAPVDAKQTIRNANFTIAHQIVYEWKVVDLGQVPRAFLTLDEKKINAAAKNYGKQPVMIPGIEFVKSAKVIVQK